MSTGSPSPPFTRLSGKKCLQKFPLFEGGFKRYHTLPETNSSLLKMDGFEYDPASYRGPIFYVS